MPPTSHMRLMRQLAVKCAILSQHVHRRMMSNSQYSCSSQQKSAGAKSQSCSKRAQIDHTQRIVLNILIGGCLECNMYQVTVLGWLKKEKMNKSDFRLFQVCHFKELLHVASTTADWGRLNKHALCTFRCKHLFSGDDTL